MTFEEHAANFIAEWEGFQAHAYWDVNHWRVGYGSDTEGPNAAPVTKDTVTTQARAKQNLSLRLGEFKATLVHAIGAYAFNSLNQNQQVALIDMVYNYGHLPFVWVRDEQIVGARILQRGKDNNGINMSRRRAEMMLYLEAITVDEVPDEVIAVPVAPGSPADLIRGPGIVAPDVKGEIAVAVEGESKTIQDIVDALETLDSVLQTVFPAVSVFIPAPVGVPLHIIANLIHGLATQLKPYA
jgi:GH24 family phage-related lysozyme (muramidase)